MVSSCARRSGCLATITIADERRNGVLYPLAGTELADLPFLVPVLTVASLGLRSRSPAILLGMPSADGAGEPCTNVPGSSGIPSQPELRRASRRGMRSGVLAAEVPLESPVGSSKSTPIQ